MGAAATREKGDDPRAEADRGGDEKSEKPPKILTNNSLGRRLREIEHGDKVVALGFLADGRTLAVGGDGDGATLYDAESGAACRVIACEPVKAMAYSPGDGRGAIAVCGQHEVVVYDALTGEQRFASNIGDEIQTVAFSRNGTLLAVGGGVRGKSGALSLLDAATGVEVPPDPETLENSDSFKHDEMVLSLDFSRDGSILAAGGAGKKAVLFDVKTRKVRSEVDIGGWVYAVSISPDSATLAVGGDSATLALCEVVTGEVRQLARDESDDWVRTVSFSPQSSILAVGGRTETVAIYDVTSGVLLKKITSAATVSALAFSLDGTLAVGSEHKKIELWDFEAGDVRYIKQHDETCRAVAFSPDGNSLAVGGGNKRVVMYHAVWKFNQYNGAKGDPGRELENSHQIRSLAFSPDKGKLAFGGDDCKVAIYDVSTGSPLVEVERGATVFAVAFSKDASMLAVGDNDCKVALIDASTGLVRREVVRSGRIRALAFSPVDPDLFAVGGTDSNVSLCTTTGKPQFDHTRGKEVDAVAFAPDGQTLAAGGADRTVVLLDVATRMVRHELKRDAWVLAVAFSPDGKSVAVGGYDNLVSLFDVETGKLTLAVPFGDAVRSICFWSPATDQHLGLDSDVLAVAAGNEITVVELRNGSCPPVKLLLRSPQEAAIATTAGFPMAALARDGNGKTLLSSAVKKEKEKKEETKKLVLALLERNPSHGVLAGSSEPDVFTWLYDGRHRVQLDAIFESKGFSATTPVDELEKIHEVLIKMATAGSIVSVNKALEAGGDVIPGFVRMPATQDAHLLDAPWRVWIEGYVRGLSRISERLDKNPDPLNDELPPRASKFPFSEPVIGRAEPKERLWYDFKKDDDDKNGKHAKLAVLRATLPDLGSFKTLKELTGMSRSVEAFKSEALRAAVEAQWLGWARIEFRLQYFFYFVWLICLTVLGEISVESGKRRPVSSVFFIEVALACVVLIGSAYFLYREATQARELGVRRYFSSGWNWFQMLTFVAAITFVIVEFSPVAGDTVVAFNAIALLLGWLGFIWYSRGFEATAWTINGLSKMMFDLKAFLFILVMTILAFAIALRVLFSNDDHRGTKTCVYKNRDRDLRCHSAKSDFNTIGKAVVSTLFAGVFGDYNRGDAPGTHHPQFTYTLLILLLSITSLILLNAMIALMSESFMRVTEQKEAELTGAKAALIVELSCPLSEKRRDENDRLFRWTYRILPESELAVKVKDMHEDDAKLADVKDELEKLAVANSTLKNDNAELKEMMKKLLSAADGAAAAK